MSRDNMPFVIFIGENLVGREKLRHDFCGGKNRAFACRARSFVNAEYILSGAEKLWHNFCGGKNCAIACRARSFDNG